MNNIYNKLITKDQIENIINSNLLDKRYRITINDISKFQKAFIQESMVSSFFHKSTIEKIKEEGLENLFAPEEDTMCLINIPKYSLKSNERLEFLGDRVIDFITAEYLFDTFPNNDQGFYTKTKAKIVKKSSLANLASKLNFKEYLLISSHLERTDGRNNIRFMEDVFESFMGALYKDQHCDLNICKNFLLGVYEKYIDMDYLIKFNDDYKSSLGRYFHKLSWKKEPEYTLIYKKGGNIVQNREFIIGLFVNKTILESTTCFSQEIIKKIKKNHKKIIEEIINENNQDITEQEISEIHKKIEQGYLLLSTGIAKTKQQAEQNRAKGCLLILDVPLNF